MRTQEKRATRFRSIQTSLLFVIVPAVIISLSLIHILLLLPMALALALGIPSLAAYGVILVSVLLGMACAMLFTVSAQTYLQRATPPHLLGKEMCIRDRPTPTRSRRCSCF